MIESNPCGSNIAILRLPRTVLVADRAASARSLLVAIDALLRSGRGEAAISVRERELGGGC